MTKTAAIRQVSLLASIAYGVAGCAISTPPVCSKVETQPGAFGFTSPGPFRQLGPMNVVQPGQTYDLVYVTMSASLPNWPSYAGAQLVGMKSISLSVNGLVDCQLPSGGLQRINVIGPFASATYPPYGKTIAILSAPFNFNQIACPPGGNASAGEIFLSPLQYDWCNVGVSAPCVVGFTPGRQISGFNGCPMSQ